VAWAQFLHQLSVVGQSQGTESTEEDVDLAYHADSKANRKGDINDDSMYEEDSARSLPLIQATQYLLYYPPPHIATK
jgi:hypothetical protein